MNLTCHVVSNHYVTSVLEDLKSGRQSISLLQARINEQLQQIHNYNLFLQKLQKLKHEALEEAEKFTCVYKFILNRILKC